MEAVVIVTMLALIQYLFFGIQVGLARVRCDVSAPSAGAGNHEFECVNRIHQNTLEQLVFLIPVLWIFANYVNPLWGAGFGVVYLIGRLIYRAAYIKNPKSRSLGFTMSALPGMIMAAWVLVVAIMSYL
jgi:glutathione S-transferase